MKFKCEDCGKEVDYVLIDGYAVGEREMEDVWFKIISDEKGNPKCVGVEQTDDWETDSYLQQFNKEYWYECAEAAAESIEEAKCPLCGGTAVVWGNDSPPTCCSMGSLIDKLIPPQEKNGFVG